MNALSAALLPPTQQSTQHALLVAWGHFARQIGLPQQLAGVPIPQKTVKHPPVAKLLTLFLGLLAGNEFLRDLSHGATPLSRDPAVADAWDLPTLPEASGVSRTLAAATPQSLLALRGALAAVAQPFLQRAVTDLRTRNQPLVLDADLTGQPISDSSTAFPGAAFGYMDGAIHLGYQIAELCLHTTLYGRQWLVGEQHPGDTVSAPCLLRLVAEAERRLGCHPRRRSELPDTRIAAAQQRLGELEHGLQAAHAEAARCLEHEVTLHEQIGAAQNHLRQLHRQPGSSRQNNPHGAVPRTRRQIAVWERQLRRGRRSWAEAVQQADRYQAQVSHEQAALIALQERHARLAAENTAQPHAPRCILRIDAGFYSGENLTALIEVGYDVETNARGGALVQALLGRVTADTAWTPVGKNAPMMGWTNYYLSTCPYPLTVALERFETAQGAKYAVLVRNQPQPDAPCPDLRAWFAAYNRRQTIEAGVKQEKSVFHLQHLMSRQPVGMQIQVALTLFAANFVGWAAGPPRGGDAVHRGFGLTEEHPSGGTGGRPAGLPGCGGHPLSDRRRAPADKVAKSGRDARFSRWLRKT